MGHYDYYVEDLDEAVSVVLSLGGKNSDIQYFETSTVMLDPEGYPFYLTTVLE